MVSRLSIPDRQILRLAPVCVFGFSSRVGVLSHLYANVGSYVVIASIAFVTLVTSLAAVACARAPYRAEVCEEESKARVRDAFLDGKITAHDASAIINGEEPPIPGQAPRKAEPNAKAGRRFLVRWRLRS